MNIDMDVKADSARVQITVPQANLSWDLANVVAYRVSKSYETILNIGEFEDEMEKRLFEEGRHELWENTKSQVKFIAPFAVDTFHPQFTRLVLLHHVYQARGAMRRGIFRMFDKLNLHIKITDFESIPIDKRKDFAYLLYEEFNPRLLVINGEAFDSRPYRMSEWSLRLLWWVAILFVFAVILIFRSSVAKIGDSWWKIGLFGMACISIGLIYGLPLLWVAVIRNFLPSHTLEVLLPTLRLPKRLQNKLYAMLQKTEMGEYV
jgi:hypothetical protein